MENGIFKELKEKTVTKRKERERKSATKNLLDLGFANVIGLNINAQSAPFIEKNSQYNCSVKKAQFVIMRENFHSKSYGNIR